MKHFDYIIAGGGMAGLSLAYYLTLEPKLQRKSILILDRERKDKNDRTWCFWEAGAGPFEAILFRQWPVVEFYGTTFSGPLNLVDYRYKMLRGIDFYEYVQAHLAQFPNVQFRQATIQGVTDTSQGGVVLADDEPLLADYVFDSTFQLALGHAEHHNLLQHFKGWVIRAEKSCFDVARPRIIDFRTDQRDDCRFFYVLPFDERTALVEYTIFNDQLLPDDEYENALHTYVGRFLDGGTYQIAQPEFGVIPMSDVPTLENPSAHVVRIGTSGGFTKPSTGYTFARTQCYLRELVHELAQTGQPTRPKSGFKTSFKLFQDSVLLNVLVHKRHPADDVFTRLYVRNGAAQVHRFLDEDTTLLEDLQLMSTVPLGPFTLGALDVLRKR